MSYELSEFFKNNHITDLEISGKLKKLQLNPRICKSLKSLHTNID